MSTGHQLMNRELRRCWRRFSKIVRVFAEKRTERNEIRDEEYESIHTGLMQSLGEVIKSAPDGSELHSAMKDLAEPWINVTALQQADTPVLKDVANRSDALYEQLTHKSPGGLSKRTTLTMMFVFFVAAFVMVLGLDVLGGLYDKFFDGSGSIFAKWLDAIERNRNNSRNYLIAFVLAVATAATAWLVFRAPRNY